MARKTASHNPTYRLTAQDRQLLGILDSLDLWSRAALGREFGVTPKTVQVCGERWLASVS